MQLGGGGFSMFRPNFFFVVIFGLIVVGLFFIPEISSLLGIAGTNSTEKVASRELEESEAVNLEIEDTRARLDPQAEVKVETSDSILGRFHNALYSGEYDNVSAPKENVSVKNKTPEIKQFTWEGVLTSDATKSLETARSKYLKLAADLGDNHPTSRAASVSMANGISYFTGEAKKMMKIGSAVQYLNSLDRQIGEAFNAERVERAMYLAWNEASDGALRDLIGYSNQLLIPAFDPGFQLSNVIIKTEKSVACQADVSTGVTVDLKGVARGSGLLRVELYDGKDLIKEFKFNRKGKAPPSGLNISTGKLNAMNRYTFKFYDVLGKTFSKTYQFYPGVNRFPYDANRRQYVLPFQRDTIDKRLDRAFLVRQWSGSFADAEKSVTGNLFSDSGARGYVRF